MNDDQKQALIDVLFLLETLDAETQGSVLMAANLADLKSIQDKTDAIIVASHQLVQFALTGTKADNFDELVNAGMAAAKAGDDSQS